MFLGKKKFTATEAIQRINDRLEELRQQKGKAQNDVNAVNAKISQCIIFGLAEGNAYTDDDRAANRAQISAAENLIKDIDHEMILLEGQLPELQLQAEQEFLQPKVEELAAIVRDASAMAPAIAKAFSEVIRLSQAMNGLKQRHVAVHNEIHAALRRSGRDLDHGEHFAEDTIKAINRVANEAEKAFKDPCIQDAPTKAILKALGKA